MLVPRGVVEPVGLVYEAELGVDGLMLGAEPKLEGGREDCDGSCGLDSDEGAGGADEGAGGADEGAGGPDEGSAGIDEGAGGIEEAGIDDSGYFTVIIA